MNSMIVINNYTSIHLHWGHDAFNTEAKYSQNIVLVYWPYETKSRDNVTVVAVGNELFKA